MAAYYNENDVKTAAWLRELIKAGLIANGEVDTRSIVDVQASDIAGFVQCHFFAGIGGWSYALRLAGWSDERLVWTGSCPCQPFSSAGGRSVPVEKMSATGMTADGRKHTVSLEHVVKFAMWPTPRAEDNSSTGAHRGTPDTLTSASRLAGWPTAVVNDATGIDYAYSSGNHDKPVLKLGGVAKLASWPTPVVRDIRNSAGDGTNPRDLPRQVSGVIAIGSPAETVKAGQLNPAHSRWLQGYPPAWDDCAVTAMPSTRGSRPK